MYYAAMYEIGPKGAWLDMFNKPPTHFEFFIARDVDPSRHQFLASSLHPGMAARLEASKQFKDDDPRIRELIRSIEPTYFCVSGHSTDEAGKRFLFAGKDTLAAMLVRQEGLVKPDPFAHLISRGPNTP